MQYIQCYICGCDNTEILFKITQTAGPVVRCRHCGLVYINPICMNIDSLYDIGSTQKKKGLCVNKEPKFVKEQGYRGKDFKKILIRGERFLNSRRPLRLLDVGSNKGTLLRVANDLGYETYGIEPRVSVSTYARETFNLNIFTGTLEQARYEEDYFHVVTLLHVLEHLQSPIQTLSEIRRVLRKDGLFILEVPNIDNLCCRIFGKHWRVFFPGHLIYFSPVTIKHMLNMAGFEVLLIGSYGRTMSLEYLLTQGAKRNKYVQKIFKKISNYNLFQNICIHINLNDIMTVYAHKR